MSVGNIERRALLVLLGTYVRVKVIGTDEVIADASLSQSIDALQRSEARFSLYRESSETVRINSRAHLHWQSISSEMAEMLTICDTHHRASAGLFDVTVGGALAERGLRPGKATDGCWNDVELDREGRRVRFHRPLTLDFGGVAKGYAVDAAVNAAVAHGADSVLVNAGGDIRAHGALTHRVMVRHPADVHLTLPLIDLSNAAVATSGGVDALRASSRCPLENTLIDPQSGGTVSAWRQSVSVTAPLCVHADALTKLVQLSGDVDHCALQGFSAQAISVYAQNTNIHVAETPRAAA